MRVIRPRVLVALCALALLAGCGGGSSPTPAPGAPAPPPPPTPPPPPPPATVTISGSVNFQRVPLNPATNGLNYAATTDAPARGVEVRAVDSGGGVLGATVASATGAYSIAVPSNTSVRIEALARLQQSSGASWNISVRDNVNGNALYVLAGTLASSGAANSTRTLTAPSGWGGAGYTSTRAAAPFAILDTLFDAVTQIAAVSPNVNLPELRVFWSTQNRAASGNVAAGEIGTTSFTIIGGIRTMLVLGDENNDTDEFDSHVIAHEFGHYLQNALSRDDSIGGSHSLSSRLDPRVAFSEGFGNAYSAFSRSDPIYRDSSGAQQANGFSFNVEANNSGAIGWFSEASSQSIIHDVIDANADGPDAIAVGFAPVFATLTNPAFVNGAASTTIFSFTDALRAAAGVNGGALDALMNAQSIAGRTPFGTGETNDGGIPSALPVYRVLTQGAPPLTICSVNDAGTENRLGNTTFLRFNQLAPATVQFSMVRTSGPTGRDPDFIGFLRGQRVFAGESAAVDTETASVSVSSGEHVITAFDFLNVNDAGPSGDVCFNFSAN